MIWQWELSSQQEHNTNLRAQMYNLYRLRWTVYSGVRYNITSTINVDIR